MSKGDWFEIVIDSGELRITADKAGRKIRIEYRQRAKETWLDADIVSRNGKPTGIRLSAPLRTVQAFREFQKDPPVIKPKAKVPGK